MDHSEPQVRTNSSQLNSEASAARRLLNATGNFLKSHKNEAVATLAAASLTLSLAACGTNANAEGPAPTTTQSAEAPTQIETVDSSPVETEAPVGNNPESLSATLSPEELAQADSDLWQEWVVAGATEDVIADTYEEGKGFEGDYADFLVQKARKNADLYTAAYFVDGWENIPQLVTFYDSTVESNRQMIEIALHRYVKKEPFIKVTETASNVIENEPSKEGERIISYDLNGTVENSESTYTPGSVTRYYDITDGTARLSGFINMPHQ